MLTKDLWKSAVSGSFNKATDWSLGVVPGATNNAFLTPSGTTAFTVSSGVSETVNALTTAANATLAITGGIFTIAEGFADAGAVTVASGAKLVLGPSTSAIVPIVSSNTISFEGGDLEIHALTAQLAGTGVIALSDGASIVAGSTASALRNSTETIEGSGTIGGGALTLVNAHFGVIDADSAKALTLNTGANMIANAGLIELTGAGGITLDSKLADDGKVVVARGALRVDGVSVQGDGSLALTKSGATLSLDKGALGVAGVVTTVAGSVVQAVAGTTDTISVGVFENEGTVAVANKATLIAGGMWTNDGSIALQGSSGATKLEAMGVLRLAGGGTLTLGGSDNSIVSNGSTAFLSNEGDTIKGAGAIGAGSAKLNFSNDLGGTVDATGALAIGTGARTVFNDGVFEAGSTGHLTVSSALVSNGALIANGGVVTIGAALTGAGVADIEGTGQIEFAKAAHADVYFAAGDHGTLQLDHDATTGDNAASAISTASRTRTNWRKSTCATSVSSTRTTSPSPQRPTLESSPSPAQEENRQADACRRLCYADGVGRKLPLERRRPRRHVRHFRMKVGR